MSIAHFSKDSVLGLSLFALSAALPLVAQEKLDGNLPPGQNFNLSSFKLQLPVALGKGVLEIAADKLPSYTSEFFYTDKATGAMVLMTPSDGAHTGGSLYPRTEFRSLTDFKISNATTSLSVTMAVLQSPKRNNIVIGQLKGESDQPIELRWVSGSIVASVKSSLKQPKISEVPVFKGLKEGQKFTYSMSVRNGGAVISVNGSQKTVVFDKSWDSDSIYWKFGNYCQDNSKIRDNYSKVAIYSFELK